jgi:hypothetical protein
VGELDIFPQDLTRVFLKIAGNACDMTDEKRRIAVEAGRGERVTSQLCGSAPGAESTKSRSASGMTETGYRQANGQGRRARPRDFERHRTPTRRGTPAESALSELIEMVIGPPVT